MPFESSSQRSRSATTGSNAVTGTAHPKNADKDGALHSRMQTVSPSVRERQVQILPPSSRIAAAQATEAPMRFGSRAAISDSRSVPVAPPTINFVRLRPMEISECDQFRIKARATVNQGWRNHKGQLLYFVACVYDRK